MVSDQHPGSGQCGWGRLLGQEKPGCAWLWGTDPCDHRPGQALASPERWVAARAAQAWRMGEHRLRRGLQQLQDRAAS